MKKAREERIFKNIGRCSFLLFHYVKSCANLPIVFLLVQKHLHSIVSLQEEKKEKKSGMFEIPTSGKLQKMHSIGDVAHKYISTFF